MSDDTIDAEISTMLRDEMHALLKDLKEHRADIAFKERATIMVYVMRCQTAFAGLRKGTEEPDNVGSAVRKYATAFSANAGGRRQKNSRAALAAADLEREDQDI